MSSATYSAIYAVLLFAGAANGFSVSSVGPVGRTWLPLSAAKDGVGSSSDGAGSWRTKAKEFKDNPEGFNEVGSAKKLNIAFVVSSF